VTLNELSRSKGHPLVQGNILKRWEVEHVEEPGRRRACVLDIVTERAEHKADIAGAVVECPRVGRGVENGHAALTLHVLLPLIGMRMPMQLPHGTGFQFDD
jgi:hypothetical protein